MAGAVLRAILVAGHGLSNVHPFQYDEGATGCGYTEHALATSVVDQAVEKVYPSSVITLTAPECSDRCTRTNHETFSHLAWTVQYLNAHQAPFDFILAVHLDASDNPESTGVSVYYANGAAYLRRKQAALVAKVISERLGLPIHGTFKSSESQHSKLAILDDTEAPALLIELGFISNEKDVENIRSCGADALADAINALRGFQ